MRSEQTPDATPVRLKPRFESHDKTSRSLPHFHPAIALAQFFREPSVSRRRRILPNEISTDPPLLPDFFAGSL